MRKLVLLISFFVAAPLSLICILAFLLLFPKGGYLTHHTVASDSTVAYAALPTNQNVIDATVSQEDGRVERLKQFFASYHSPLEPYAEKIVSEADTYDLDFRLLPAIAMQESGLCRRMPKDSYNCWGFGIYGGKVTRFDNFPEAIHTVTKTLATKYKQNGLNTPEEIMSRYTPSSNGSWAFGVNTFMAQLQ
ncbi:MAG: hypothetical protein KGH54_04485 [Candidatus Micrarchaeota archaeon]|nr:hypothetical protein [Candidatus Micrarchaeota archaeon]